MKAETRSLWGSLQNGGTGYICIAVIVDSNAKALIANTRLCVAGATEVGGIDQLSIRVEFRDEGVSRITSKLVLKGVLGRKIESVGEARYIGIALIVHCDATTLIAKAAETR